MIIGQGTTTGRFDAFNPLTMSSTQERDDLLTHYRHLPEIAIWALLERLADAACMMQNGHMPGGNLLMGWANEVVHNDLKPLNIFLGKPETDAWPSYPTFQLGDWGSAEETFAGDPRNPEELTGWGTEGCCPPEQAENQKTHRLGYWSNIWAIGNLIVYAMNLPDVYQEQAYFKSKAKTAAVVNRPAIDADADNFYTDDLKDLVGECIKDQPTERITPTELRERIRKHVEQTPDGEETMRYRKGDQDVLHYYKTGKYELWSKEKVESIVDQID